MTPNDRDPVDLLELILGEIRRDARISQQVATLLGELQNEESVALLKQIVEQTRQETKSPEDATSLLREMMRSGQLQNVLGFRRAEQSRGEEAERYEMAHSPPKPANLSSNTGTGASEDYTQYMTGAFDTVSDSVGAGLDGIPAWDTGLSLSSADSAAVVDVPTAGDTTATAATAEAAAPSGETVPPLGTADLFHSVLDDLVAGAESSELREALDSLTVSASEAARSVASIPASVEVVADESIVLPAGLGAPDDAPSAYSDVAVPELLPVDYDPESDVPGLLPRLTDSRSRAEVPAPRADDDVASALRPVTDTDLPPIKLADEMEFDLTDAINALDAEAAPGLLPLDHTSDSDVPGLLPRLTDSRNLPAASASGAVIEDVPDLVPLAEAADAAVGSLLQLADTPAIPFAEDGGSESLERIPLAGSGVGARELLQGEEMAGPVEAMGPPKALAKSGMERFLGSLFGALDDTVKGVGGMGRAVRGRSGSVNPDGSPVAAPTSLGGMLAQAAEQGKEGGMGGLSAAAGLATKALGMVAPVATAVVDGFNQVVGQIGRFVEALNPALMRQFGMVMRDLNAVIGVAFEPLMSAATQVARSFADTLFPAMEAFRPIIDQVAGTLVKLSVPYLKFVSTLTSSLAPILQLVADLLSALAPLIQVFYTFQGLVVRVAVVALTPLIQALKLLADVLGPIFTIMGSTMEGFMAIIGSVVNVLGTLMNALMAINPLALGLRLLAGLLDAISPLFQMFTMQMTAIGTVLEAVIGAILTWVGGLLGFDLKDVMSGLKDMFGTLAKTVIVLTAHFMKAIGMLDAYVKGVTKAVGGGNKKDSTGLAAATNPQITGVQQLSQTVMKASLLAGPQGQEKKTMEKWQEETVAELQKMQAGQGTLVDALEEKMKAFFNVNVPIWIRMAKQAAFDQGWELTADAVRSGRWLANPSMPLPNLSRGEGETVNAIVR